MSSAVSGPVLENIREEVRKEISAQKEEDEPSWLGSTCQFVWENPLLTAQLVIGGAIGVQFYRWGILDIATRPLTQGYYFDVIPVSILSTAGLLATSYTAYNAVKGAVGKVAKTISEHPYFSAMSAYSLYQTGIASLGASMAWSVATMPTVRNTLLIGAGVDYAMNCISRGEVFVPETALVAANAAMNPAQTYQAGVEAAQQTAQQVMETATSTLETAWNYSERLALLGAAATATAVWLGAPALAIGSAVATAIPAIFSYYKRP